MCDKKETQKKALLEDCLNAAVRVISISCCIILFACPASRAEEREGMIMTLFSGRVTLTGPLGNELDIQEGMELGPGHTIKTASGGLVSIRTYSGNVIRLNSKTEVHLDTFRTVMLKKGELFAKINKGERFSVRTPVAVAAVRGTELNLWVGSRGKTVLTVLDGIVEFENSYGRQLVDDGMRCMIKKKMTPPAIPETVGRSEMPSWHLRDTFRKEILKKTDKGAAKKETAEDKKADTAKKEDKKPPEETDEGYIILLEEDETGNDIVEEEASPYIP